MDIFKILNEEQQKLIKIKTFPKNTTIFYEGEVCEFVCFIKKGEVKISSFTKDGKEIIFNHLTNEEVFGNNLIFSLNPIYKGNVVTLIDSELIFINKNNLIHLLKHNTNFLFQYLSIQSDFGKSLNSKIMVLSTSNIKDRLTLFLQLNNNKYKLHSISELANELSVTREALSRCIHRLVNERVIKINHKIIELVK